MKWSVGEKYGKQIDVVVIWGHLYGKFTEKIYLKAPGSYPGPFWSYNFSICLSENPKAFISMMSGLFDVSLSFKTNIIYLWRPQDTWTNQKDPNTDLTNILFLKSQNLGTSRHLFRTNGHRTITTIHLITSWKSCMRSISIRHEMEILVIWYHWISEIDLGQEVIVSGWGERGVMFRPRNDMSAAIPRLDWYRTGFPGFLAGMPFFFSSSRCLVCESGPKKNIKTTCALING